MPSTNDANEGQLGAYRVNMRNCPSQSMHQWNSLRMFSQNDTQAFMDATFQPKDHTFIMEEARRLDAAGLEKDRKRAHVEHSEKVAQQTREERERRRKATIQDMKVKLANLRVFTIEQVTARATTVAMIDEQLDLLQVFGEATEVEVPKVKRLRGSNKSEKQKRLLTALQQYYGRVEQGAPTIMEAIKQRIRKFEVANECTRVQDSWEERDIENEAEEDTITPS
jgi:hypothetical protein